jgi:hypothetical protein
MGTDKVKPISRIKMENLPYLAQAQAKAGPFGLVRIEEVPNDGGVRVSVGSFLSFTLPDAIAMIIL